MTKNRHNRTAAEKPVVSQPAPQSENLASLGTPPPPVPLHTPEMQDAELREMLGGTAGEAVTLGSLMALWLARSPYLCGGVPTAEDEASLLRLTRRKSIQDAVGALDTALRPLSIIKSDNGSRRPPCYDGYGPEWLADIVAAACRAMPSLTWSDAVWRTPLCTLGHLAGAAHRAAGGCTERPFDTTEADAWLLRVNGIHPKNGEKAGNSN